jgi:Dolichyl-phosphate-mannose-protein mannosyltransferase
MAEFPVPVTTTEKRILASIGGCRRLLGRVVDSIAAAFQRHSWILFPVIALLFVSLTSVLSYGKPLWHDELFTYYIAQAPDLKTLIHQTRTLDLNPPLMYLVVRGLFRLFHVSGTVARIPSIAGFTVCMGCLYVMVSKRLGALWGAASALFFATGDAFRYALEARPYGMMLGFLGLAFVGWQQATEEAKPRNWGLLLLIAGGIGALLSHVFAIIVWMVLVFAELVRIYTRRSVNWKVLLALFIPTLSVVTYIPLIRNHAVSYYPAALQPNLHLFWSLPVEAFRNPIITVVVAMTIAVAVFGLRVFRPGGKILLSQAEVAAFLGFLAVPFILIVYLMKIHGAFFSRYGIIANFALAVLIPTAVAWLTRNKPAVAFLVMLTLFMPLASTNGNLRVLMHPHHILSAQEKADDCDACNLANKLAPDLPLVDASGLTFLEMDSRQNSNFLSRVYYLTDAAGSFKYAHASIFEGMQVEKNAFPIRANVAQYSAFIQEHPKFLVLGTFDYPEDWLLRKLLADGASLRLLAMAEDDQFKDQELWQITISDQK